MCVPVDLDFPFPLPNLLKAITLTHNDVPLKIGFFLASFFMKRRGVTSIDGGEATTATGKRR